MNETVIDSSTQRKWGVFEDLADKKRRIEEECCAAAEKINAIMRDIPVNDVQFNPDMSNIIDEATDHYIAELDDYLVHTIGWTGMRLRHVCPVCRARMTSKCAALFCGHVFCRECVKTLEVISDDEEEEGETSTAAVLNSDETDETDETDEATDGTEATSSYSSDSLGQYMCGVCRAYSGGMMRLYL